MVNVTVLGAGAWGIGLGLTAYRCGHQVTLWSPFEAEVQCLSEKRHHPKVLTNILLPEKIQVTGKLEQALHTDIVLCVTPAQTLRAVISQCQPFAQPHTVFISCAKGIEVASGQFLTDIIQDILPNHKVGALAGPNFAHEVAVGLPAQAVLAMADIPLSQQLATALSHENFHIKAIQDVRGTDLASAVKNVLAIGCGIITGAGLGENARAAYLTQGLQDLNKLGAALKCDLATFYTVGGIGDIMLTCLSQTSRNMNFGLEIGAGQQAIDLDNPTKPLTEGVYTVKAIKQVMDTHQLDLSSIHFVDQVLYHHHDITRAFAKMRL